MLPKRDLLELLLSVVLIAYVSFAQCITDNPDHAVYRSVWETSIGTALRLLAIVLVAKYVSPLVALLFVANLLRCSDRV
jgi:hypothetical protein